MLFRRPAVGSLARRFAFATAALAIFALVLTALSSWWLVSQQHKAAMRILSQKEAEFHATTVSRTLHAVATRMAEVADSSILATGLVDSAGRETYLRPFLASIRQINGVPIDILFTDFAGVEISSNGDRRFTPAQLAWLRRHLDTGRNEAAIVDGPGGPELIAVELLSYSRTRTPEGALLYKVAVDDLRPDPSAHISWRGEPEADRLPPDESFSVPVGVPALYKPIGFHVVETERAVAFTDLVPQYGALFVLALALAAAVLVIGSRLSLTLTRDLEALEAFSRSVIQRGFGRHRAELGGSTEVKSLAESINHMLDRLYDQHSELENQREKLYQLANTIPQLAWIASPEGRTHWYNDRWYEYTGTTPDQMKDFGWQSVYDPDVLEQTIDQLNANMKAGKPFQMTIALRGADGEFRSFLTLAAPLHDASGRIVQWFGTNTDVSELEQAQRAVRDSEERLQQGLVAARMAVWDWDLETGRMTFSANSSDIFGQRWDDAGGGWKSVHPDDAGKFHAAIEQAVQERSHFGRVIRVIRGDTRQIAWIDVRGKVQVDKSGAPRSIRGIALDVTERKRSEEALRTANRRKDEFLAMLAHELRNPLAPISTAAEILRIGQLDPARVKLTSEIISRQVTHMTSLVDDLLDVSRVTRGLVKLDKAPVDIAGVVSDAVEQVRPLIETRRHRLSVRLPSAATWVDGDRIRLVQVVANLLNNAAKYTLEGGEICLGVHTDDDAIALNVRDTGIGIAPELLPHVFELFTQAERSPDRSQGGLGLGLALVHSLIELHDGTVAAASEGPNRGSVFTVRLPRLRQRMAPGPATGPAPGRRARPLRVMIVDDNADAARSLAVLMEAEGHEVMVEHTARQALERARRESPQVFLLDIGLPDMDGYELARSLRAMPETANAMLIAVSGYGRKEDRNQSRGAGFDHHLVKPANLQALTLILDGVPA